MFFRYLLYALIIYLLYRLVFDLIIPVYKTSRRVRKQFQEMHDRMEEAMKQQSSATYSSKEKSSAGTNTENKKDKPGDYIEFEEVK